MSTRFCLWRNHSKLESKSLPSKIQIILVLGCLTTGCYLEEASEPQPPSSCGTTINAVTGDTLCGVRVCLASGTLKDCENSSCPQGSYVVKLTGNPSHPLLSAHKAGFKDWSSEWILSDCGHIPTTFAIPLEPENWQPEPPPALVLTWGEAGTGPGELSQPTGIDVDAMGRVYVAQYDRVQIYNGDGAFLNGWPASAGGGVAVGADFAVFVSDLQSGRIRKFTQDGDLVASWGDSGIGDSTSAPQGPVALDNAGNVWVAGGAYVYEYDHDGHLLSMSMWTLPAIYPKGMGLDDAGNLYIASSDVGRASVGKYNGTGVLLDSWGGKGTELRQFISPHGLDIDSMGNVYVTDHDNYGQAGTYFSRVQRFKADGTLLGAWGSFAEIGVPSGIAIAPDGSIYVADRWYSRVLKFAYANGPSSLN